MSAAVMDVLCVIDYFLPGFRGGGPIRTLDNMRKQSGGDITLSIFTRDRDLGSDKPYPDIEANRWIETPDGPIYYASPHAFGPRGLKRALAARKFEMVYLNSFFSPRSSVLLYLALRKSASARRILLAPRGEFSPGALAVKQAKKRVFLRTARLLGLYRDISWHASTHLEAGDILRHFPEVSDRIHVAPDPVVASATGSSPDIPEKKAGHLRVAFISRIARMKNLVGLLGVLQAVRTAVEVDIFGPVEDEPYWRQCQGMIATLPDNVRVRMQGTLAPHQVSRTFARYDLFAFPTHGENFGHVIFEALCAGTPVLISDQTPWCTDEAGAVTALPLSDIAGWRDAINAAARRTPAEQARLRQIARDYATGYAATDGSPRATFKMFRAMLP